MPQAITLRELLKDPIYKEWFKQVPTLRPTSLSTPNWRIFAREESEGKWSGLEVFKYSEAYAWVRDNIRDFHDIVISSKRQAFRPPVVRQGGHRRYYVPMPSQDADVIHDHHKHTWCPYCRRPTLFLWYKKHHAMRGTVLSPNERRCCVCGVRLTFIKRYV